MITKPLGVCYGFAAVFNLIFLITPILGEVFYVHDKTEMQKTQSLKTANVIR